MTIPITPVGPGRWCYRDYEITDGPGYTRNTRFSFHHADFDGAPNNPGEGPGDRRYGTAASLTEAMAEIDEQIDEN